LRDQKDNNALFPEGIDRIRTLNFAPAFTSNSDKFGHITGRPNFQSMLNAWYAESAWGTGEHGSNLSTAVANQQVIDIVKTYQDKKLKRNNSGVGDRAWKLWRKIRKQPIAERKEAIRKLVVTQKFWDDEVAWAIRILKEPQEKCRWSIFTMIENSANRQIPDSVWDSAFLATVERPIDEILTLKKGLYRDEESNGKPIGATGPAALCFLTPILGEMEATKANLLASIEEGKLGPATALSCCLLAFQAYAVGTFCIVNKEDSIEKARCIAIMDWAMRMWANWIENMLEPILAKGGLLGDDSDGNTRHSVLEVRDKTIPLKAAEVEVERAVKTAIKEAERGRFTNFVKPKTTKYIKLMNDASAWGPWKNLVSMYVQVLSRGLKDFPLQLFKAVVVAFVNKEMVPHHSLFARAPPKNETNKQRSAREAKEAQFFSMMGSEGRADNMPGFFM
jgi:hypothetical protein